jgi:hypothetical protein
MCCDTYVWDSNDVATWDLFLLFPHWCLLLYAWRGKVGHKETRIQLQRFFFGNWEELQEHLLHAQVLVVALPLVSSYSDGALLLEAPTLSSHSRPDHFCQSLALRWVGEYVRVVKAFTPLALILAFLEIVTSL